MSYTNTTTHFQWPLPEETDLFNGLDDNQMKEDLDEKIYNLEQRSTGDHEAVEALTGRVTQVEQTVGGYDEQIEQLEGTVGEHAERLINLTNRQTELSRRLNGKAGESTIAPEYNEEETYTIGDFVYHNNILYKATSASATPAGAFDADDWDIAILTDELGGGTHGTIPASNVTYNDVVTQLGANNAQDAIVALKTLIDNIGGNAMPVLDYANPLHTFSTGNLTYTATKDCYIMGNLGPSGTACTLKINGTDVAYNGYLTLTPDNRLSPYIPPIKIKAGDVIAVSSESTYLHIFDVVS